MSESGPTEIIPISEPPEFGICTFISTTTLVPEPVPATIADAEGRQQVRFRPVECASRCVGPECGVWSREKKHCSLVCLSEISNKLGVLEPSGGGGALGAIVRALEDLGGTLSSILYWFNKKGR